MNIQTSSFQVLLLMTCLPVDGAGKDSPSDIQSEMLSKSHMDNSLE